MQENPAIVKSYYDKRIVGCPGGEGGQYLLVLNFDFSSSNLFGMTYIGIDCMYQNPFLFIGFFFARG